MTQNYVKTTAGLSITTHTTPARMATFILFLSAVFLFTSYAASIVVLLQSTSQAIKNRKDLADTAITFSVQDTRHNYIYFNVRNPYMGNTIFTSSPPDLLPLNFDNDDNKIFSLVFGAIF